MANATTVERRLGVMGTTLHLEVAAEDRARALAASEAAVLAIEDTERRLSTWRGDSELARLNRTPVGQPVTMSERTATDLKVALACARVTAGAFDPTVGALVEAWGLRGRGQIPDAEALRSALSRTGHRQLEVDGRRATRRADLRVEEGGFGKGASLDRAAQALLHSGARAGWIDLGGQVLVFGRQAVVPIAHPAQRDRAALHLTVTSGSLSTTGNSERGLDVDGARFGHVLDPRTGRPATEAGSVSVLAPSAVWADCLSTALYVLGPAAALEWVKGRPGVEVVVIEPRSDEVRVRASEGLRGALRAAPGAAVQLEFDDAEEAR